MGPTHGTDSKKNGQIILDGKIQNLINEIKVVYWVVGIALAIDDWNPGTTGFAPLDDD